MKSMMPYGITGLERVKAQPSEGYKLGRLGSRSYHNPDERDRFNL